MAQKTLGMTTERPSLRAKVVGWDHEDADLFIPGKSIGHTPSPTMEEYRTPDMDFFKTVLEAQHYGWKLLAPPQKEEFIGSNGEKMAIWSWLLVKD